MTQKVYRQKSHQQNQQQFENYNISSITAQPEHSRVTAQDQALPNQPQYTQKQPQYQQKSSVPKSSADQGQPAQKQYQVKQKQDLLHSATNQQANRPNQQYNEQVNKNQNYQHKKQAVNYSDAEVAKYQRKGGNNKELSSQQIRCSSGNSCAFYKQGKCKFYHEDDDDFYDCYDQEETFKFEGTSGKNGNPLTQQPVQQKQPTMCPSDMVCEKDICVFIHSTASRRSPAYELRMQLNGVQNQNQMNNGMSAYGPMNPSLGMNNLMHQQMFPMAMPPQMVLQQQQLLLQQYLQPLQNQQILIQQNQQQFQNQVLNRLNQNNATQSNVQVNKDKQQEQKLETLAFHCYEEFVDKLGVRQSLESIKRSNNALIEFTFKDNECNCKIKLGKNVQDLEKLKEQISQAMPFYVECVLVDLKFDDYQQIIQQFKAKYSNLLTSSKVVIISDLDYKNMKHKHNNSKKIYDKKEKDRKVYFFGQKAKNEDVQSLKNQFQEYEKEEFSKYCSLKFGNQYGDVVSRTHICLFLQQTKTLDEILKTQGCDEKIIYHESLQNIYIKTTLQKMGKIQGYAKKYLDSIKTVTLKLNHNIIVHKTLLPNQKKLLDKVEEKFKVLINETATEIQDASNQKNEHQQTLCKFNNTPFDRDAHLEKQYEIQVTGTETDQAIFYIHKILDDYLAIEPKFKFIKPDEFIELKEQAKVISLKYQVLILFKLRIHLIGRQSKGRLTSALEDLQKAINTIQQGKVFSTKVMPLNNAPNVILMELMKGEKQKISDFESKFKVSILIDKDNYVIAGSEIGITSVAQELTILEQTMLRKIQQIQITQKDRITALKMKRIKYWEQKYEIQIMKTTVKDDQSNKMLPGIQNINSQSIVDHTMYQWSYKVNRGDSNYLQRHDTTNDWFAYDQDQNDQIEKHYKYCCKQNLFLVKITIIGDQSKKKNDFTYQVYGQSSDPNTWIQQNTLTGFKRPLQRVELKFKSQLNKQINPMQLYIDEFETTSETDRSVLLNTNYYVKGLKEKIDSFFIKLDIYYSDPNNHTMILSLKNYQNIMNKNMLNQMNLVAKNKFDCKFDSDFSIESIKIIGLKCQEAGKFLENLLDKARHFKFPKSWEKIDKHILDQENLIIIALAKGCHEWTSIENHFKVTMPQAKILNVERIQNKKLWRNFKYAEDDFNEKWGQPAKTLMLYHGTRKTKPSNIYDSEEGFNMLFSSGGMWGQAIYFAQNSSYSNDYKFITPQNTFQIFFARVLVGNSAPLPPNKLIKMPPIVEGDLNGRYYDSIQGNTAGSDVFMIYANKKAYPEYLITYQ
eukprot:403362807